MLRGGPSTQASPTWQIILFWLRPSYRQIDLENITYFQQKGRESTLTLAYVLKKNPVSYTSITILKWSIYNV